MDSYNSTASSSGLVSNPPPVTPLRRSARLVEMEQATEKKARLVAPARKTHGKNKRPRSRPAPRISRAVPKCTGCGQPTKGHDSSRCPGKKRSVGRRAYGQLEEAIVVASRIPGQNVYIHSIINNYNDARTVPGGASESGQSSVHGPLEGLVSDSAARGDLLAEALRAEPNTICVTLLPVDVMYACEKERREQGFKTRAVKLEKGSPGDQQMGLLYYGVDQTAVDAMWSEAGRTGNSPGSFIMKAKEVLQGGMAARDLWKQYWPTVRSAVWRTSD
ncbi:hypothetical protein OH77DRAFT_1512958 [Trametes cingulata]|nr:hypothetical protein OH77DRAFT_1512958 [Trametes cingulata]